VITRRSFDKQVSHASPRSLERKQAAATSAPEQLTANEMENRLGEMAQRERRILERERRISPGTGWPLALGDERRLTVEPREGAMATDVVVYTQPG
jgi:hypothetical protein